MYIIQAMETRIYMVVTNGEEIPTDTPGQYAGWRSGKIFGTLDCKSGMRMKRESRIFFATMGEAILRDYRPCNKCKPMDNDDFDKYTEIIPEASLEEFYARNKR